MKNWEYKIIMYTIPMAQGANASLDINNLFETTKKVTGTSFFGNEKTVSEKIKLSDDDIECIFNKLGKEGWELSETLPIISSSPFAGGTNSSRVYFIFKRAIE